MPLIFILDKLFNRKLAVTSTEGNDKPADAYRNWFGLEEDQHYIYYLVLLPCGFLIGNILCRLILILHLVCRQHGKQPSGFVCGVFFRALICLWDTEVIEMMTLNIKLSDDDWDGQMSLKSEEEINP